jgi:hypothetical protein
MRVLVGQLGALAREGLTDLIESEWARRSNTELIGQSLFTAQ